MADRIRVNTDDLEKWSRDLTFVADALSDANSALGDVDTSDEAGGDVKVTVNTFFKSITGKPTTGPVRTCLAMLRIQMGLLKLRVNDTSKDLTRAASLFTDAESEVSNLVTSIIVDPAERARIKSEIAAQEAERAREAQRHAEMYDMLQQMAADERRWDDVLDKGWLIEAAGVGLIFTALDGNLSQVLSPHAIASNVVDKLLDMYGDKSKLHMATDDLLDYLEGDGSKISATADFIKSILDDANAISGKNSLIYDEIRGAGDSAQVILDAAKKAYEICNMDPAKIAELKNGLRLNGDEASHHAATLLDMAGNYDACFLYCLQTSGSRLSEKLIMDITGEIIEKNPTAGSIKMIAEGTILTVNNALDTTSVASKAQHAISVNNMRVESRDAVLRAIEAYQHAPSEATYNAVSQAYEAYNALSAEMANAYHDAAVTNAESALGKIFYDADQFDVIKDVQADFASRLEGVDASSVTTQGASSGSGISQTGAHHGRGRGGGGGGGGGHRRGH